MKTAKHILLWVVLGACIPAVAKNGMQTTEFEMEVPLDTVYIDCLGEYVAGPFWVTARGRFSCAELTRLDRFWRWLTRVATWK